MILVCGIHSSGKNRYCDNLKLKYGINSYTASQLIDSIFPLNQNNTKRIDQIENRQQILINAIRKLSLHEKNFILNAHLCLINMENQIERISLDVFQSMPITEIYLVECSGLEIKQRIYKRDRISWDISFIDLFLQEERKYAIELAKLLNIPIRMVNTSENNKNNIILPIAPRYIEKIFSGEKKYEYRKRLCKNDISKIYLYATAPVKGIVGEVEVIEKMEEDTKKLWSLTSNYSGIDIDFYNKYFRNCTKACAYKLGKVIKYKNKIPLQYIGITHIIQSFVYINDR